MKITIVGFWGGYPAKNGATSSYLVEKDNFTLMIDIGSGALSKVQNYKSVSEINAVIVSHYHHDHVADIGVLQYAYLVHNQLNKRHDLLPIYGHQEDEQGFKLLSHDYTTGIPYDPNESLEIGPFKIEFLKTNHSVPCYGMKITSENCVIVYTADSAYQEEWIDFSKNADLLIADCNFYSDQDGKAAGHMNSSEVGYIAEQANVRELILSHLPQYGEHENLLMDAKGYFNGKVQLAFEGLTWTK